MTDRAGSNGKHGNAYRYKVGCRCAECKKANTEKCQRDRQKRSLKKPPRHGALTYSNWGCRCEICCAAWSEKMAKEHASRISRAQKDQTVVPHGRSGYVSWGCRCEVCKRAEREELEPIKRDRIRSDQASARDNAHRNFYHWTGPELEIASRTDLTAKEVALMLGRTVYSVIHKRQALKVDPRAIGLAGIPRRRKAIKTTEENDA